jgi:hypothetical protein
MDLNDFTEDDTDEPAETGPELNLYTAGSGNGKWAYTIEGADTDKRRRDSYDGDAKGGFDPQMKAVAEGTERVVSEFTNAKLTIYTPSDSIADLMDGENDPDPSSSYWDLYRKAKRNYNNNWELWSIKHFPKEEDNPARELMCR